MNILRQYILYTNINEYFVRIENEDIVFGQTDSLGWIWHSRGEKQKHPDFDALETYYLKGKDGSFDKKFCIYDNEKGIYIDYTTGHTYAGKLEMI